MSQVHQTGVADFIKSLESRRLYSVRPANAIANPKAKPTQIAAPGREKFLFSGRIFDAGRMLEGIATVTENVVKLDQFILENPNVFAAVNLQKLAGPATTGVANAVKNPDKLLGAVVGRFDAFRTADPVDIAGQAIPAGVFMEVGGAVAVAGLGKSAHVATGRKNGTAAFADAAGETFAASPSTWITVFGQGHADTSWMLDVMKGLNVDTKLTNCVDVAMMLDMKLKRGISISTRVADLGKRSLSRIEHFYGQKFSVATRSAFEKGFTGVKREVRGILALPDQGAVDAGRVINFVYKPGEGMWYLDGQLSTAYQQSSAETAKMFSAYAPKIQYMITN